MKLFPIALVRRAFAFLVKLVSLPLKKNLVTPMKDFPFTPSSLIILWGQKNTFKLLASSSCSTRNFSEFFSSYLVMEKSLNFIDQIKKKKVNWVKKTLLKLLIKCFIFWVYYNWAKMYLLIQKHYKIQTTSDFCLTRNTYNF